MTAPSAAFAAAVADRYTIERLLGAGGMAHVWLARDLRHDRRVALKVLRQDLGAAAGSERFLAEIRTTAQLVHPHILPLLDSGESGGLCWFASPYIEGETLRARLRRETQLPVADAVRIASEIASALDAAHRRGIVHRDVKPENILFQDDAALVADFGIALAMRGSDRSRLTETGTSLGTPHYMSPEQAAGDRQLDTRTDIYALGAVLYEMLTGEPPHSGATAQAVLAKVISEEPTRVRTVRPTVSPALEAVVHRALAKTPADRFRSAGDMVAALSAPDIVTPSSGTPARTRRDRRARRRAAGLVVVAIAIVAGLASWPFVRRSKSGAVPLAAGAPRIQLTRGGNARAPALTPDGLRVAYAVRTCDSAGACLSSIEVRDIAGAGSMRIATGLGGVQDLSWSPDGRWLLAQANVRGVWGVYVIPALGGEPRFVACCYGSFLGRGDTVAVAPSYPAGGFATAYLHTTADGVLRDSIVVRGRPSAFSVSEASPGGDLLAMVGVDRRLNQPYGLIVRRDGTATDTFPPPLPFPFAMRWSARGDALYSTARDTVDRRLIGWNLYPVNPTTGRKDGDERPILSGESSQFGRFDVSDATGDMVIELSNRRHVVWLLTLDRGRYTPRLLRGSTLSIYASFAPNGREIVLGTAEGDSTLTVSRLDLETGRETVLGSVGWGIAGSYELALPARQDESGNIILTRPNLKRGRTDVLRLTPGGQIDTIVRTGFMFEAVPLGAGSVVYADQATRLVRAWPGGSADTLNQPDTMPQRHDFPLVEPSGDDGLVFFVNDDASQYHAVWTVDWRSRRFTEVARFPHADAVSAVRRVGDTAFVAVQATAGGSVELVAVPLLGSRKPRAFASLPTSGLELPFLQISPDRRRVLVIGTEDFSDIWLVKGALTRGR